MGLLLARHWLQCLTLFCVVSHAALLVAADPLGEKRVKVVIDYADGVEKHFTGLPWEKDMTVLDVMKAAKKHPRGIQFESRGKGATTFIFQIDDVKNEASGRGWLFRVNGLLSDRSCGIYPLKAGDIILWKYEKYR